MRLRDGLRGRGPRPARRGPSLRLLLGGLALCALFLPFGLAVLARPLLAAVSPKAPSLRLESLRLELVAAVRVEDGGLVVQPGYAPPEGMGLVISDSSGLVLLSTVPTLAAGSRAGLAEVSAALPGEASMSGFFFEAIRSEGAERGRYFAWYTRDYVRRAPKPSALNALFPIILLALGASAFALGVAIATMLARAVLKLERAADRIASGDLESPVQIKGIAEIGELAASMDGMRAALLEDRDRRARFLAAVSHDLRTPLTSIGGYLEAVQDGLASDPGTLERYVAIMRGKTRLLESRISDLIEFARMETAEWRLGFEPLELRPLFESLAREARQDAALLGRELRFELSALDGAAHPVDKALLSRAVENILSNAVRYSPAGSPVRMTARRAPGGRLCVDFDDEGPGLAPAERERVFEAFVRGSASRQGEGSGLGLYIARSVILGHGWNLVASASPGGGGRFSIVMPPIPGSEGGSA